MSRLNIPSNYNNIEYPDFDNINDPKKKWDREDRPRDVKSSELSIKNQEVSNKLNNQSFMATEVDTRNSNFANNFEQYIRNQMIPSSMFADYTTADGNLNLDKWTSIYDDFNPHQIDNMLEEYNKNLKPEEQVVLSQVKNDIHNKVANIRNDANVMRLNFLADWEILNTTKDNPYPLRGLFKNMEGNPKEYDVWWDKVYGADYDKDDWSDMTSGLGYSYDPQTGGKFTNNFHRFSNAPIWNNPYLKQSITSQIDENVGEFTTTQTGRGVNLIDVEQEEGNDFDSLVLKNSDGEKIDAFEIKYDKTNSRPYVIIPETTVSGDNEVGFNASDVSDPNANRRLYLDEQALDEYEVYDMAEADWGDYLAYSAGDDYDYAMTDWVGGQGYTREQSRDRRGWRKPKNLGELVSMSYGHGFASPFKVGVSDYGARTKYDDPNAYNWRDIID